MTTALTTTNRSRDFLVQDINGITSGFRMCKRAYAMADDDALAYHRENVKFRLNLIKSDMKWVSLGCE